MIPHLSRVLELWRIAAHYRLDTLVGRDEIPARVVPLLTLIRLHPAAWQSPHATHPLKLKLALEDMGPLAIKLGQLLSTRRDLITPEILQQLVLLQDQVRPFPVEIARQRIERALGEPLDVLFARFDDQPLAAASIAQVHTAALHDGREVVVKVTRPDIRLNVLRDFEILTWLAQQLEHRLEAARAMHLLQIVQDYRLIILNELDLTIEADNTRRMRHEFTGSRMMYVPEVYRDSVDVMVAERVHGVQISDTATLDRLGIDRAELAENGLRIFFTQVLRDNFFHADMHPGNVLIETSNAPHARYIALDCAIMGELSRTDQMTVARMLLAVMNQDFMQLIGVAHQAGWIPPSIDRDALARDMRRTVGPMVSKPMNQLDFAGILIQVMDIARRYHLDIPPQLMLLLKTLVHVEGMGSDLYPDLDIWKLARPILTEWVKTQMDPRLHLKRLGQQLPDVLLGAHDVPGLLIDGLNNLRHQAAWQDRQYQELQQLRLELLAQQRQNWLFGCGIAVSLAAALILPALLAPLCLVLAILLGVLRVLRG